MKRGMQSGLSCFVLMLLTFGDPVRNQGAQAGSSILERPCPLASETETMPFRLDRHPAAQGVQGGMRIGSTLR